ncbi:MAG: hypothetical protein HOP28_18000 [Gemmatimonadales bacterium]|nr:hypothetical protein [Gemmatimonadales bacterium]
MTCFGMVALGACATTPTAGSEPNPIVSLTLVAGHASHFAFVTRGARPDSTIPAYLDPIVIPPHLVALRIVDPSGAVHAVVPDVVAGRYRAELSVVPGGRYRLEGTIAGRSVSAMTEIPGEFELLQPTQDTIRLTKTGPSPVVSATIPLQFRGEGVAFVAGRGAGVQGGAVLGAGLTLGGDGLVLTVFGPGVYTLELYAYNRDAYDWLVRKNPRGNMSGAFGGFTGAILRTRTVIAQ